MKPSWTALVGAGLLPPVQSVAESPSDVRPGDDVLPWIRRSWTAWRAAHGEADARPSARFVDTLLRRHERGAKLTWGLPGTAASCTEHWLGNRLAWWPRGVPLGRRIGLVSSRLGHELDRHRSWFAVLRTACMRIDSRREILVTAQSASTGRFVQRCGQLFGLPVLVVETLRDESPELNAWLEMVAERSESHDEPFHRVCLSPVLQTGGEPAAACGRNESRTGTPARREQLDGQECPSYNTSRLDLLPLADRAIAALSDRLIALHTRPGGNLEQILRARLESPGFPPASVFLALGRDLVSPHVAEPLMAGGAVGWFVMDSNQETITSPSPPWAQSDPPASPASPIITCPPAADWPYLTHCTRRRHGPWPDEDEADFLDDLILDRRGADHSAFAALWRIVTSRRLIATSELVRGDVPVVSFTAVPLVEIDRLRAFRAHLSRWDFEPYGICIRRDWLQSRGARPVRYGDESVWTELPLEERHFFQKCESHTAGGRSLDWTAEREWRHVGDISLDDIPPQAALLFVPSRTEAETLAGISPWPIVMLSSTGQT